MCIARCFAFAAAVTIGFAADDNTAIENRIRKRAIPIASLEPDYVSNTDLAPLKKLFKQVQVVGGGESTHGSHEFVRFKHRLFRFLVTEMGFNAFVLESSYSGCKAIDEYVVHGQGNRAELLTNQGYTPWDTQEMTALIDWIREHNSKITDVRKRVRFIGIDLNYNQAGRDRVLNWLKQNDPGKVADATETFRILAEEEGKWPRRVDQDRVKSMLPAIQRVVAALKPAEGKGDPLDDPYLHARIMEQWVAASPAGTGPVRTTSMAETLQYILKGRPDLKAMYYASNAHVLRGMPNGEPNFGSILGTVLGKRYYALGFQHYQGMFRCRGITAELRMGDYMEVASPPVGERSIPGLLHKAKPGNFFLDLTKAPEQGKAVSAWLKAQHDSRWGSWVCHDDVSKYVVPQSLEGRFDGVLLIETITPSTATPNGQKTADQRRLF